MMPWKLFGGYWLQQGLLNGTKASAVFADELLPLAANFAEGPNL